MALPKLLAVDDEREMLDFLERLFRGEYEVLRAGSAEEALKILEDGPVHVIVCDQRMPGMTGTQLLESIRDRFPELTKVLLSGYAEVPDIRDAVERCRIHQYVLKPVDGAALRRAVKEAREQRARGGGWTFRLGKD